MAKFMPVDGELPLPAGFRRSSPASAAPDTSAQKKKPRHPEVDWIKAVGIVTVVFIHALPTTFEGRISPADAWLGRMTRFAVPGFLACSGFLYAGARASRSWAAAGQRLRRLLLPYVLFSAAAWAYTKALAAWAGLAGDPAPFAVKLLLGSALGPYYYVFVIVCLVLATPLVARIPQRVLPWVVLAAVILQLGSETGLIPAPHLFWQFRSPLRHAGPFLVGWLARAHYDGLLEALERRRIACHAALLAAFVLCGAGLAVMNPFGYSIKAVEVAQSYVVLGLLFVATVGGPSPPELVSWLSNASYTIYLAHLMFLTPVLLAYPNTPGAFDPVRIAAVWAAGIGNAAGLVLVARACLGEERARQWLG